MKTANEVEAIKYDSAVHGMADAMRALEAAISLIDVQGIEKYSAQISAFEKQLSRMKPFDWSGDVERKFNSMKHAKRAHMIAARALRKGV